MTTEVVRAAAVMSGFGRPWGIAGGWAIDLFLGRQTRPHADIDVAVLRDDQRRLRAHLAGAARIEKVVEHRLDAWAPDETLELPIHEVHVCWPDGHQLEFLLNERDGDADEWLFRRDARVRRAMDAAFGSRDGVPYLAPEIVLLYKSKSPRATDEADFAAVVPRLSDEQRGWLREALRVTMPDYVWRW